VLTRQGELRAVDWGLAHGVKAKRVVHGVLQASSWRSRNEVLWPRDKTVPSRLSKVL
jgi:hypothetical protein